ncbi:MAG: T9SS type A sorting domain-containing protein [Bacteroidales bacterium]|nr:T9SS type A sorting domain-containing protein [Bacteroidales bacterium]MBN2819293.1 T9SS type A sorting domain-containing protein [Bacteroidales bacterium]
MNMLDHPINQTRKSYILALLFILILFISKLHGQNGVIIPTSTEQNRLIASYRFALEAANSDYRTNEVTDKLIFSVFGESSVYRITEGNNAGSFVYPDALSEEYTSLTNSSYSNYNWQSNAHVSVQFKAESKRIAIFKSKYKSEGTNLSWESIYFERLFSEYLMDGVSYLVDEDDLVNDGLDANTELLIIPAFIVNDDDYTFYIDSIISITAGLKDKADDFLSRGGSIYAEGNGAYFIEKLGYLETGAISYQNGTQVDGLTDISVLETTDILSLGAGAASNKLYGTIMPQVNSTQITPIVSQTSGNPCLFKVNSDNSNGGKIQCNTGLPTVFGLSNSDNSSQQISWTLNSILAAFSSEVDVTRKVKNEILYDEQIADNAIPYDRIDTLEVELTIRNLSGNSITVDIQEAVIPYFTFINVVSGPAADYNNQSLLFSSVALNAHSELVIRYRLATPEPDNAIHENVNKYLSSGTLINVANNTTNYSKGGFKYAFKKNKAYADILFSARIFADTDVNYKNFLGLTYQPFKVFMIMENKSRSAAENTEYIQYIPKDVPFYWSDNSINIPILKTPGGKYVDVLRGSNDESSPDYDMDGDGDPDVWLDTASIFPKGYTLTEESVYWANPWNHLRTGDDSFVFEDIDHDGIIPEDTDGDGIVDSNFDEDDKIRVWKVTWDIGRVAGYEYYDPYCSYEIWVDPPDLIPLSAGVADAYDSLSVDSYPGMFYPYDADISDTTWSHWMERDDNGNVIWDQLIHQKISNYEGFTFVDTSEYQMLPTDSLIGTAPQPHREFIAVLSLGGEEIDMRNYTPKQSLYSKVNYETVFGEEKVTPIRTTYTYWAPLPNPLQFEYLSNNYEIFDTAGETIQELPEYGNAHLVFDMDASTEYTYYWIRNVGYDVDYNDLSEILDGVPEYGDGVFGYFIYSIPKGMGGYRITLPKNEDGTYNTDSIVQIDGQKFSKWIDNPNTWNEVEIWESAFEYQVYIPQLLIPAALDDDNFDGKDDWIDDRGDRFSSKTGFLHDAFMPGDGEDFLDFPTVPFTDDIYGKVDSGWYSGADGTYGDDFFETLGKTHITIHADYEGRGREGSVEISKGGVLVCEEIFGGSPWVIFSHVLSGYATGTDISLKSEVVPEMVYMGIDTVYLKHIISDTNEPHAFNYNFDPYHISYGFGESTITTFVGAKDPCTLIEPAISMSSIVDPAYDEKTITLVPYADLNPGNPDLAEFPKQVTGTFFEVRVEVGNSTNDNWINTCVKPQLKAELGTVEMSYVAYPRPLVPSHVEGDEIVPGDQPGTFTTGWRFNQPESEVLIKMGDTLNLMQPTRKAYFVFLIKVNPALEKGIYKIPFTITGTKMHYDGTNNGSISYQVPDALFSVVDKDENGRISAYQKMVIDNAGLSELSISTTGNFVPTGKIKYSNVNFSSDDFDAVEGELSMSGGVLDLNNFTTFPATDTSQLVIMQEGIVDSYNTDAEILPLTNGQVLSYSDRDGEKEVESGSLSVRPLGPRIRITNEVYSINGTPVSDTILYESDEDIYVVTMLTAKNTGTDISSNSIISINPGPYYTVLTDSLDENCSYAQGILTIDLGDIIPGERKKQYLPFMINADEIPEEVDIRTIIDLTEINYEGTLVESSFEFEDPDDLLLEIYDFEAISINFTDLGDGQVEVTARAHNRGIIGNNVWFRIYPVIGNGVHEFAIAELSQEEFLPGETIELKGTYTLPNTDKSIDFIAIVDDAYKFVEMTELNNLISINYEESSSTSDNSAEQFVKVYPTPFVDVVSFEYTLTQDYYDVDLSIYNMNGQMVDRIANCSGNAGQNFLNWRKSSIPDGTYIFMITGKNNTGSAENIFQGQILKSSNP